MRHIPVAAVVALSFAALPVTVFAQFQRGKVVMPDASVPLQKVFIERACPGSGSYQEAVTNRHGEFLLRMASGNFGVTQARASSTSLMRCVLYAKLRGFESNAIDLNDPKVLGNPQLPVLVLHPISSGAAAANAVSTLPKAALKSWESGAKALAAEQWADAEKLLREVAKAVPQFAVAWTGIGLACVGQQKPEDARQAFQKAIQADPSALQPRLLLTRLEITTQHWGDAAKSAEALIFADDTHRYPEAHLHLGIARYELKNLDAAQSSLLEALRLDPMHKLPQAEYFLGAVLAGKGERAAAVMHLSSYLEHAPAAPGEALVRQQIEELGRETSAVERRLIAPDALLAQAVAEPEVTATGEAWVPGGRKSLAAVAHMKSVPEPADFFLEYCRTIAVNMSRANEDPIAGYQANLQAFVAAVAELTDFGERRDNRTILKLSLAGPERPKTERVLALLGWKIGDHDGAPSIEPGDQPVDGPRQQIPPALGIDELAMRSALEAGREFQFEIVSENATLVGGAAWGATLEGFATLPGGIAEAFIRQPRLAKTYAGLNAMGAAGLPFARHVGLRTLVATHADALWMYGDALRLSGERAVVPGGPAGEDAWTKLAGASPRDGMKFFHAMLTVDRGRLAAFFAALAHADDAHQKFFLKSVAGAQRYYSWYRDSEELREGIGVPGRTWRPGFFKNLPLDGKGAVLFPGNRAAWSSASNDDDALLPPETVPPSARIDLEALLAASRLETQRGRPLGVESAKLLAQHSANWRSLTPYFESMPGLGLPELEALTKFTAVATAVSGAPQNTLMGEWHSLVAIIVLARKAGSLDDAAAAHAFGEVCRALSVSGHSALAALRTFAGDNANLDDAVATLLRLSGSRRAAFDRVRDFQNAPRLQSLNAASAPSKVLDALTGVVYGALLDPAVLLVNEDHGLLQRHVYVARGAPLFQPSSLVTSNTAPGSHLAGGFVGFDEVARGLARAAPAPESLDAGKVEAPAAPSAEPAIATLFRADARLVEAHTTVTDERGRYVDGLTAADFTIRQAGKPLTIAAFENGAAPISCALLLDTSQSMDTAISALKSAALKLIAALRPNDTVAVYSLNGGVSLLQPFTTDREAATRAVLRVELDNQTALYDALVRVNRDLSGRTGRKVVVVFTDGEDNASTLTADTAILRAKTAGVPIYTVAQGHALRNRGLLKDLAGASQATGGLAFSIQSASEIGEVFGKVFQDLLHGYLLAFAPPPSEDHAWRPIQVQLRIPRNLKVRSREGYYPE